MKVKLAETVWKRAGQWTQCFGRYYSVETDRANIRRETMRCKRGKIVKSPLVGTFYAAPSEDAEPFVVVGESGEKRADAGNRGSDEADE